MAPRGLGPLQAQPQLIAERSAFLVQVSLKDCAITVRLLPATDPKQKTPGVKRLLGLVAGFLRGVYPASRFGKTNLQGFLDEPAAPL